MLKSFSLFNAIYWGNVVIANKIKIEISNIIWKSLMGRIKTGHVRPPDRSLPMSGLDQHVLCNFNIFI